MNTFHSFAMYKPPVANNGGSPAEPIHVSISLSFTHTVYFLGHSLFSGVRTLNAMHYLAVH